MPDFSLEPLIRALADEFRRRDMRSHLQYLRVYYRGYIAQRRRLMAMPRPPWSTEMVVGWLMIFRIPPFEHALAVLGRGAPCPACRHLAEPHQASVRSVFPGGVVRRCPACDAQWLQLEEQSVP